jgi:hypothetical protein
MVVPFGGGDNKKASRRGDRQGCIKLAETARIWQGGQSSDRRWLPSVAYPLFREVLTWLWLAFALTVLLVELGSTEVAKALGTSSGRCATPFMSPGFSLSRSGRSSRVRFTA